MALVEAHEHAAVLGRDRRKLYVTDKPSDAYDAINSVRSLVYVYGAGFSATRMNPSRDREAIDKDRHDLLRYLNPEDWRYPEEFCVTFIDRILRVGSSYWWKRLPGLVDADNASTLDPVAHGVFRFLDGMAIELWRMPAYSSSQTLRTASERLLGAYRVFYNTVKEVLLSSKDESYDRLHIAMGQFARIVYWVVGRYEAATLLEKIHLHFNPAVLRRCIMHFLRPRASALSKGDISAFCATDGRLVWTCIDKQGTYLQDYTHANHQWRGWLAGCQKKLDEKAVSASNHAHLVLGLIPPNVRDVVGGIWESVNLLNRGNIEMIARTLCGSRRIQPPSSYDRVVAIARAGAVFGTLLAVTENKQLSLLNIRPAWHCRPYPSVLERLLIVDDQVLTGFTMAAAEQGFLDQWFCRRNLTWLALAKCKVFDRGDALNPVQFANIHGHLKTFEDCRTLAAYDLADENVQIANAQFIQPTIDITDHVESSEALAMQSRLESVFERCREPENVEEMREDLQKRITKTCLARQRNLVERTSPWRERLFGYSAKRFYKPELLFNEPSLLLQIARYFYWTEVRPRDIRVIIATSGAALPIATCLGLLSMWFEEKGMGPRLSIMLAQQGGSHIVGLSQYANDRKRHGGKFATLATVFGAGRRDRMIQESLAAFRWPQKAVHDKDCCGERGEKAGFKRDMILAVFDYQPLQCSERPAVPIKSIVEIKE
jgi:hypoxanthine phosphoribosyltransferase